MARKITILPGEVYGRLTTVERTYTDKLKAWWKCVCSCGNYKTVTQFNLVKGNVVSCGCKKREVLKSGKLPTFSVWEANMRTYIRKLKDAAQKPRNLLGSNQFAANTSEVHARFQYLVDSWDLSVDQYQGLVTDVCFYCGKEPSSKVDNVGKRGNSLKKNGIDRVDNNFGYTITNCVTSCVDCNKCKGASTQQDFLAKVIARYYTLGSRR